MHWRSDKDQRSIGARDQRSTHYRVLRPDTKCCRTSRTHRIPALSIVKGSRLESYRIRVALTLSTGALSITSADRTIGSPEWKMEWYGKDQRSTNSLHLSSNSLKVFTPYWARGHSHLLPPWKDQRSKIKKPIILTFPWSQLHCPQMRLPAFEQKGEVFSWRKIKDQSRNSEGITNMESKDFTLAPTEGIDVDASNSSVTCKKKIYLWSLISDLSPTTPRENVCVPVTLAQSFRVTWTWELNPAPFPRSFIIPELRYRPFLHRGRHHISSFPFAFLWRNNRFYTHSLHSAWSLVGRAKHGK